MSSKKDDNNCGCIIGTIAIIAVIVFIWQSNSGKNTKIAQQSLNSDPHTFVNASDLYTFPKKEKLSEDRYATVMDLYQSLVKNGAYPEDPSLRPLLLELDGAANFSAVNARIENSVAEYKNKLTTVAAVVNDDTIASFTQANALYEAGNYSQAAESYMKILEKAPIYLDARNNLGLCDLHLGNNVSAIMQFNLIMAVSPKYTGAEQNLSVALERIGLSEKAYEHAKKAAQANSSLPMAQYNLGWFEARNKNFEGASSSYQKALKLQKNYPIALRGSAINKLETGNQPAKNELAALPKAEQDIFASAFSKTITGHPVAWWWWVLMVIAILVLIGLTSRADGNFREGTLAWGVISIIGVVIALIVFAIWYNGNTTYSTVLWAFVIGNGLLMIPLSARNY